MDGVIGVDAPDDMSREGAAGAGEDAGESLGPGVNGREWVPCLLAPTGLLAVDMGGSTATDPAVSADAVADPEPDQMCDCCCCCGSVRNPVQSSPSDPLE